MITGTHRFHGQRSLRYVYQHGKTVRGGDMSLRFVRNEQSSTYRIAVVASRKVSKSAVVRNRIRRRIYEIVRGVAGAITVPYDLVFTVYSELPSTTPHAELKATVLLMLQRATVLPKGEPGQYSRSKETNE